MKKRTHVAIVLDRSSSMGSTQQQAIDSFNEQVDEMKNQARQDPDLQILVSLITFSSDVKTVFNTVNLNYIETLTKEKYSPSGMTALFDGIARAIEIIDPLMQTQDAALVIVITDGYENNSSKENTEESTVDVDLRIIKAPLIGTYYESAKPGEPAFINVGQSIKPGQSLCIIEAMKIFNEIEAEYSGEIIEILVNDGDPVEYGQPLFALKES